MSTPSTKAQAVAVACGVSMDGYLGVTSELSKSITAGNLGPAAYIDGFRTANVWTAVSFEGTWVDYSGVYYGASYLIDAMGFVHLRGLIKSGTVGTLAFQLPAGFKPAYRCIFSVTSNDTFGRLDVLADGTVIPESPCNNNYVSLEGVTFFAEQ